MLRNVAERTLIINESPPGEKCLQEITVTSLDRSHLTFPTGSEQRQGFCPSTPPHPATTRSPKVIENSKQVKFRHFEKMTDENDTTLIPGSI